MATSFRPEREKKMTWLFSDALIFVTVMEGNSSVRGEIIKHDTFGIYRFRKHIGKNTRIVKGSSCKTRQSVSTIEVVDKGISGSKP